MARQLRLRLGRPASYARDEFVHGPSNAEATRAVDAWPRWHGGCLVLAGPEGVGKTHLAQAWAENVGATILDRAAPDVAAAERGPALLEEADRGTPDEALFHLINLAARKGGGLLMTARTPPGAWKAGLPDLRSRLNALPVATLSEPDDKVLEGVLRKFFKERSLRPAPDIYPYLLRRIERSAAKARDVVRELDEAAMADHRPVNRLLARDVLEGDNQTVDLFE
jgi:chromosomal replication initiation ATPase DnaA